VVKDIQAAQVCVSMLTLKIHTTAAVAVAPVAVALVLQTVAKTIEVVLEVIK
jgi:hypothetical protein